MLMVLLYYMHRLNILLSLALHQSRQIRHKQGVYVTSTKKQKMMISRSIVDKVKKALVPPGRFLEKDPETDLWSEVGDKKALEKTAQALRDGAAPLRKQMSEDFSDPNFLAAVFDHGNGAGGTLGVSYVVAYWGIRCFALVLIVFNPITRHRHRNRKATDAWHLPP